VFRHRVEWGEESQLVPSHLFYLSGCDLRCGFCIGGINAFDASRGTPLTSEFFNVAVEWGRSRGAINIQWVGGEPTIHLPAILDVMSRCPNLPSVVWKSDFHFTPESFSLLDSAINVYVADFKFGNDRCAKRIAAIDDYTRIVMRNLLLAAGSRRGSLIVRHLLLPGHERCCYRPIVRWMREHMPSTPFSILEGYLPSWRSNQFVELRHPLRPGAGDDATNLARQVGLEVVQ
jgi:putative pyruvate formate lyase activating enzyme